MDAQVVTPVLPQAVEALVDKLQVDSGKGATVTLLSDGFSEAQKEQKFKIVLVGKSEVLTALVNPPDVQILYVSAKRSGKNVRTTINLQVAHSSVHLLTSVN